MNQSDEDIFDPIVEEALGHYVYVLIDPRSHAPFYVGKGGGRRGSGNQRVLDHFREARSASGVASSKVRKIRDIWADGLDVRWRVVRSRLRDESEAFSIECALVDTLEATGVKLDNEQSGHGRRTSGIKGPDDLRALRAKDILACNLPEVVAHRPIFLFNISAGIEERRASFDEDPGAALEQATCQFWSVSPRFRQMQDAIAIGCVRGISRCAVEVDHWRPAFDNRWEIVPGNSADSETIRSALEYKDLDPVISRCRGFWQYGGYLVFRLTTERRVLILRGEKSAG